MSLLEASLILLAGVGAGTINTVVGSGTLITFPTLIAFGYAPVTANVSNTIGLVPGSISGAWGYRRELAGQAGRAKSLAVAIVVGASAGALLLLTMPSSAFKAIVPVLVALGIMLVVVQPKLSAWVAKRHAATGGLPPSGARWVWPAMLATGVYGGYFGAAQGIIQMAILGSGVDDSLQRLNALKNVLTVVVNAVSGLIFIVVADVDWQIVGLIAVGAAIGGQIGAGVGRRLPPAVLRGCIVVVGLTALGVFLFS